MWVMTERKLVTVSVQMTTPTGHIVEHSVQKFFDPGDPAPPGHEGRPYTRLLEEAAEQRIEEPAPNRMLDTSTAKKRGRPRKVQA